MSSGAMGCPKCGQDFVYCHWKKGEFVCDEAPWKCQNPKCGIWIELDKNSNLIEKLKGSNNQPSREINNMNLVIGRIQFFTDEVFDFGIFGSRKNSIYKYVLLKTIKIGWIGIHIYRKPNQQHSNK